MNTVKVSLICWLCEKPHVVDVKTEKVDAAKKTRPTCPACAIEIQKKNEASWLKHITNKYRLTHYHLDPTLAENTVASWCGFRKSPNRSARKAQYPVQAQPHYTVHHAIAHNAIGWNENNELMFLFLKNQVPQHIQG